jgi:hypothetical protein
MRAALLAAALCALTAGAAAVGAEGEDKPEKPTKEQGPGAHMDYGPVIHYFLHSPADKKEIISKAISIRLGTEAGVSFDAETMRLAAGWTGGFLDMTATTPAKTGQGSGPATVLGKAAFAVASGPGWAGPGGAISDPRMEGIGNLPASWAAYKGLYRHGDQVVLSYTVGESTVAELPGLLTTPAGAVFLRTIEIAAHAKEHILVVAEVAKAGGGVGARGPAAGSAGSGPAEGSQAVLNGSVLDPEAATAVAVASPPKGATLAVAEGRILLHLPAGAPCRFTVAIWSGAKAGLGAFATSVGSLPAPGDLAGLCAGGPAQGEAISAPATLGAGDEAYVVDTLHFPASTPWKSWFRPTGLDFFADGRLALCTFEGEVWVVSGLDPKLDQPLSWRRLASGLFEPLGLKVVDDVVYVLGRDQITRLNDLNKDGEADFYECFFNNTTLYKDYHDFSFGLETDRAGNFYFVKGANRVPYNFPLHSCMFKIAKDGQSSTTYATGFRAPNGMGMGPNDELTASDNQGHWIPSCLIDLVRKGGRYAYVADPRLPENKEFNAHPPAYDPPLCWIPMNIDNSSGGEVWDTTDRWGPFKGQMLHLSYGQSTLFAVSYEEQGGVPQGGVVGFKLKFASGLMRGRFDPVDGQLYLCGIKGWQTNAGADGCLQRVRYTGKPVCMPNSLHVISKGVTVGFTTSLDRASVTPDSISVEEYNYRWTSTYGSADYKVSEPEKKGRDKLEVRAATLAADGRTVTIELPGFKPAMQMEIKYRFKGADGAPVANEIYNTINVIPK